MGKFKVEVIETLSKLVDVEANDIDEAIDKVRNMYHDSDIVLSYDDFIRVEIEGYEE
jgi:hypothetical protein